MKTEILTGCDQAIAAVANGIYQGVFLALLVALGLKLFGRINAATRHSTWFATLVLLLGIIPAHYWLDSRSSTQPPLSARASDPDHSALRLQETQEERAMLPFSLVDQNGAGSSERNQIEEMPTFALPLLGESAAVRGNETVRAPTPIPLLEAATPRAADSTARLGPKVSSATPLQIAEAYHWGAKRMLQPVSWNLASGFKVPRLAGAVLLGVLSAIAGLRLALLICRLYQIRRLKTGSAPARSELEDLFQHLRQRLGVRRKVELRVSPVHRSPVVLGFCHPVILLPLAEASRPDTAETEQILRHELAHVRRGDDWANLVQHFVQTVFFFHPAVWWISRQLALEREIACDDYVIEQGGRPRAYALLLANLASRIKSTPPTLSPGASSNKSQLQKRINMILNTSRNTSTRLAKTRLGFITSAAGLIAVLALYSAPRLVLAQTHTPPPAAKNPPRLEPAIAGPADEDGLPAAAPSDAAPSVAEADPQPTPRPMSGESGPRFKLERPGAYAPEADLPVPPTPPSPPTPAAPSRPQAAPLPARSEPRLAPFPPGPGKRYAEAPRDPSDLEQRLERLERMVRSLMEQQNLKHTHNSDSLPLGAQQNPWVEERQIKQLQQRAEQEAARAAQETKRATEQAKRATKDHDRAMQEKSDWDRGAGKEASQKQLEALRKARETLERQMEKLDAEIQRLQQDQDKPAPEQRRQSELEEFQSWEAESQAEQAAR